MFIDQLPRSNFLGEFVHVFPELLDGTQRLVRLKTHSTDLWEEGEGQVIVTCSVIAFTLKLMKPEMSLNSNI